MSKYLIISLLSLTTVSCVNEATQINAPKSTQDRIGGAITSPLTDFNIVQTGIPAVLTEAVKNPYLMPPTNTCAGLSEQVKLLDTALGPDLDAIIAHDKTNMEKGSDLAQNEAVGGVERTISGAIPFRSWIRKLSGAESRDSELHTAVAAGVVRRAFLKGMGQERGCEAPAAPLKRPAPDAKPSPACDAAAPGAAAGSASSDVKATCAATPTVTPVAPTPVTQ
jgi:hypothetical protein